MPIIYLILQFSLDYTISIALAMNAFIWLKVGSPSKIYILRKAISRSISYYIFLGISSDY